ncbi:hypothetical protein OWV82_015038 [Melia azedarach]|uniref:Uncharacterized protein n=1 Tax=Melia azedarach TaxID=155640 RepID=A0ACC1XN89_MELAZ|nr:hypothetical protein OWV82_015038 [Melia azedarach]
MLAFVWIWTLYIQLHFSQAFFIRNQLCDVFKLFKRSKYITMKLRRLQESLKFQMDCLINTRKLQSHLNLEQLIL